MVTREAALASALYEAMLVTGGGDDGRLSPLRELQRAHERIGQLCEMLGVTDADFPPRDTPPPAPAPPRCRKCEHAREEHTEDGRGCRFMHSLGPDDDCQCDGYEPAPPRAGGVTPGVAVGRAPGGLA